ncbi:protein N-terminal glutamine amidohydrolase isoform X2 [Phalaenopsis equestris]|uniref:protein N-terminal glutamine amidohydrolase isoform X2 n=1 Tax=Phalaenopsis equestris TaxID=78828 RepID=UPI0009E54BF4|nr:protein N-terminal glutamine amidohydrolase isoform X2 [Phalaenopsis equestris]
MTESGQVEDDLRAVAATVPSLLWAAPPTSGWNSSPKLSSFTHTPYYCEENVYFLCKKLGLIGLADPTALDLFVVFISNDDKKIPLWNQKASKSSDGLVIWDYHVICIQIGNQKNAEEGCASHLVWDLDSSLPFPLSLDQYISETFRPHLQLKSSYKRILRVIHAPIFLQHFTSNRTHMRNPDGNWIAPPPNYEPIISQVFNLRSIFFCATAIQQQQTFIPLIGVKCHDFSTNFTLTVD